MGWSIGKIIAIIVAVLAILALFVPEMQDIRLAFGLVAALALAVLFG